MKRTILSAANRYKVLKMLEEMLEPDGDGYVRYTGGKIEEQALAEITSALGVTCTAAALKELRQAVFGNMRRGQKGSLQKARDAKRNYAAEISALNEAVASLMDRVQALENPIILSATPYRAREFG